MQDWKKHGLGITKLGNTVQAVIIILISKYFFSVKILEVIVVVTMAGPAVAMTVDVVLVITATLWKPQTGIKFSEFMLSGYRLAAALVRIYTRMK